MSDRFRHKPSLLYDQPVYTKLLFHLIRFMLYSFVIKYLIFCDIYLALNPLLFLVHPSHPQ